MKNLVLAIPIDVEPFGTTYEDLFTKYKVRLVDPMPNTRVYEDKRVIDVILKDNFTNDLLPQDTMLTPPIYDEDGVLVTPPTFSDDGWDVLFDRVNSNIITPYDEDFINYLGDVVLDDEGAISLVRPTTITDPHVWGGHPPRIPLEAE